MIVLTEILKGNVDKNIPFICDCNFLLRFTKSSNVIECTNVLCPYKNSEQLGEIFHILGMNTQMGPVKSLNLISSLKLMSPMEIFNPEIIIKNSRILTNSYPILLEEITRLQKTGVYLEDYMRCFFMNYIGDTRCVKLFSKFNSPSDFFSSNNTRNKMESLMEEVFKINRYTDTIQLGIEELEIYKPYILKFEKYFKFKSRDKIIKPINIAITGEINRIKDLKGNTIKIKPREKIREYVKERYGVDVIVNKQTSDDIRFLIMDEDMEGHRKFNNVSKKNSSGKDIKIIKSDEFQKIIETMISKEIDLDNSIRLCMNEDIDKKEYENNDNDSGGNMEWI